MTLDIDGKKVEEPDAAGIVTGFESIDKTTGFRSGGLSLLILSRNKGNALSVSGHSVEGWGGLILDVNGVTSAADISGSLSQEKVIQIFQSYARGDDLWEKEFQWDVMHKRKLPPTILIIAILLAISFLARSCVKGH